ncbi:MAG: hypothetical protein Q4B48_08645, partial [Syntrophomonadaceae bacterium]|nr:hypothetical protein [Syntrophomonadaceae bacterium]
MERQFNYVRLAVVAVLALALLLGGQWALRRQYVEQPLTAELLALPNVAEVSFDNEDGRRIVYIVPREAGNIYREYQAAKDVLHTHAGQRGYEVEFTCAPPSPPLQELWEDLQPALYQALAQDEYMGLRDYVDTRAQLWDSRAQIYVDGERFYLQLSQGKDFRY